MLTTLMYYYDRTLDVLAYVCGAIIIAFTFGVCADITLRFFFNSPIMGLAELSEYALLYITFLGSAWLLRSEGHVITDLVVNALPRRGTAAAGIISSFVGLFVSAVLVWYGMEVTWDAFDRGLYRTTILEFPKGPLLAVLPFGGLLLFVQFIRRTNHYLEELRTRGPRREPSSSGELEVYY